jgi:hypothetical protein
MAISYQLGDIDARGLDPHPDCVLQAAYQSIVRNTLAAGDSRGGADSVACRSSSLTARKGIRRQRQRFVKLCVTNGARRTSKSGIKQSSDR